MSDTAKRIISAIVMIAFVVMILRIGPSASLIFVGGLGILALDEIMVNFFRQTRNRFRYHFIQSIFALIYFGGNFLFVFESLFDVSTILGLIFNLFLVLFLVSDKFNKDTVSKVHRRHSFVALMAILLPLFSYASVFHRKDWLMILIANMLIVFVVDSAAWFFGKNFGRHKLWEKVSPKKTIEGLIGGVLTSAIITSLFWKNYIGDLTVLMVICFVFMGLMAQAGDLVQSKAKRIFEIKDSSSLIPGHGGVYDRIDAFVFVAPLYVAFLRFLIN